MKQFYLSFGFKALLLFIFSFLSSQLPAQDCTTYNAVVAQDGSGNYLTVKAALAAAPTGRTTPWRIFIKNGSYYEKDTVPTNKPFIHLIGESATGVNITHDDYVGLANPNGGVYGTNGTQTFYVLGHNFTAESLTFSNPKGVLSPAELAAGPPYRDLRAVALFVRGDRAAFKNVRVVGGQDVLNSDHSTGSRQYFKDCYIEGGVDFIFGSATAVFENCTLFCVSRAETNTLDGHVTASSKLPQYPYGFVFLNCDITGNGPSETYTLGRPWKNNPDVVFLNTYMGDVIWSPGWGSEINAGVSAVSYTAEYNNVGPGAENPRPPYSSHPYFNSGANYPQQRIVPADSAAFYTRTNVFSTASSAFPVTTDWDPCAIPCLNICTPSPAVTIQNFAGSRTNATQADFTITLASAVDRVIYELQRSSNNVSFTTVSQTLSNGSDAATALSDNALPTGTTYYRVNVIKNGVIQTSQVVTINNVAPPTPFGAGNIVVVRVGDGSAPLTTSATATFLNEYTSTLTAVRSIPLPTVSNGNRALTLAGTANTEGMLSRSPMGGHLALVGYDATPGTAAPNTATAAEINRVVGLINYNVTISTSTALSDFASGGSARSAVTLDSTNIWVNGSGSGTTGGIHHTTIGATTSTFINNTGTRTVNIFGGQLYGSRANGEGPGGTGSRIFAVGTGTPTASSPAIELPGVATAGNANQFYFADLSATEPGLDVLYYADDALGFRKFSLVGGSWIDNGAVSVQGNSLRGLTASVSGTTVNLYGSAPFGLFRFTDNTGHAGAISNAILGLANPLPVAVSPASNTQFRGIALAPIQISGGPLPVTLTYFNAAFDAENVKVLWNTSNEINTGYFVVERSTDGNHYASVGIATAKNTPGTQSYSFNDVNPVSGISYYRLRMVDIDGSFKFSGVVVVNNKPRAHVSVFPNPAQNVLNVSHSKAAKGSIVKILSAGGTQMASQTVSEGAMNTLVNVSSLSSGIYLMVLKNGDEQTTIQFVKQ